MTLVDLDSIQFYQPPNEANLSRKKPFKASTARGLPAPEKENPPKGVGPSDECNIHWGDSPIKYTNIADPSFQRQLSPLRGEVSTPKEAEADLGYKTQISRIICAPNHGTIEDNGSLSFFEDPFCMDGEIAKLKQQAGSDSGIEEVYLQNMIESDGGEAADLNLRYSKDIDASLISDDGSSQNRHAAPARRGADCSSATQSSDGFISEGKKQSGSQTAPSTPSMSVASSEVRFPTYRKKRTRTARVSSCDNGGVSSANDTPASEPTDKGPSVTSRNEYWWDSSRVEQRKECKETNRITQENSLPSLRPAKRKYRPSAHKKPFRRRDTKRHRFSSPFSSDLEIDTGEESDHSIYTPSKACDAFKSRPPFYPISLDGNASEDGKMETASERSGMAVIFEQQSWEGLIIDERDTKQGRGRPRKQYLVQWKPSWVDGSRLTASELVRIWREKKAPINF